MGSSRGRGNADHLPVGRFAVPDPDDPDRLTFWRVEATNASGSKKELRPWPPDVRWAPLRPPYPLSLDSEERKAWSQRWYDTAYFGWKEAVIEAIAVDPEGAAEAFEGHAPTADLPEPTKPRPRQRVRPRGMSATQRRLAADRLIAEALARAGMSERRIAGEMGMSKTTTHRRLTEAQKGAVGDWLARVVLSARVEEMLVQLMRATLTAKAEDAPMLRAELERIRSLQALAEAGEWSESDGQGLFRPRLPGRDPA